MFFHTISVHLGGHSPMASPSSLHTAISPKTFSLLSKPLNPTLPRKFTQCLLRRRPFSGAVAASFPAKSPEFELVPVQTSDCAEGSVPTRFEMDSDAGELIPVGGFEGVDTTSSSSDEGQQGNGGGGEEEGFDKMMDRVINASIVLAAGAFSITKLLTIDHDYWHGWTIFEILRYAPQHSWIAYEQTLKTNPVFAKMVISGVVYSVGDWIAQCYEGKPLFDFDRTRTFRSGLTGFALHGSLSHYYYEFCEALFPFQDWWVVPLKVVFDQTVWSAIWNSIYFTILGLLRLESPISIYNELRATFWPMLTAGWKLWPFAHLVTYGLVPVEQRLLWVDCVELIWVTILSTYSNEKSEARILEASAEDPTPTNPSEE